VVESQFSDSEGSEAVGFSHGDFRFVVQALDYPAGEQLFGLEVVEDEIAMSAEHASNLLHRFNPRAHGLAAPLGEEFSGPGGRFVFPELLEILFEQIGADGLQIVAEQIAEAETLVSGEILFPFEETPACFLQ